MADFVAFFGVACLLCGVVHVARSLLLVAAEHAADDGQAAELALAILTLLLIVAAEAECSEELVDTKATEQSVDQAAEAEAEVVKARRH